MKGDSGAHFPVANTGRSSIHFLVLRGQCKWVRRFSKWKWSWGLWILWSVSRSNSPQDPTSQLIFLSILRATIKVEFVSQRPWVLPKVFEACNMGSRCTDSLFQVFATLSLSHLPIGYFSRASNLIARKLLRFLQEAWSQVSLGPCLLETKKSVSCLWWRIVWQI